MLKGQAKKDYQRNYMRKRRMLDPSVRPKVQPSHYDSNNTHAQAPEIDADGNPVPEY